MKKILSVVLAVMMMFAVMVPVFAAPGDDINEGTANTSTTIVKTDKDAAGAKGAWYVVQIPAEITVPWGKTDAVPASYNVAAQLELGKKLVVTVASDDKLMSSDNAANTKTLPYDFTYAPVDASDIIGEGTGSDNVTKFVTYDGSVTVADWKGIPVDAYNDILTFTVTEE